MVVLAGSKGKYYGGSILFVTGGVAEKLDMRNAGETFGFLPEKQELHPSCARAVKNFNAREAGSLFHACEMSETVRVEFQGRSWLALVVRRGKVWWHYLSDATCLKRPHLFCVLFVVSRIVVIRHIV